MRYTLGTNIAERSRAYKESLVYLALWLLLMLMPIAILAIKAREHADVSFDWAEIAGVWVTIIVFAVPFLVHNHLIAPLLIYHRRTRTYFLCVLLLLAGFFAFQRWQMPPRPEKRPPSAAEQVDMVVGQEREAFVSSHKPHAYGRPSDYDRPPFFFQQMDLLNTIVLVLILGMNLGVKLYFKQEHDRKRMLELERQTLEHQLTYLKFQVNPHFFMNTLNNIHALVDIDPDKAKESIVVLSRMMRYLLYDGNAKFIPLEKELSFIRHYFLLMRMRYTDHVRITASVPDHVPDSQLPPLILFTFVENAFKHGITYKRDCFIDFRVEIKDGWLLLHCRNSKADKPNEEQGGVGLSNLCQRLSLIYGDRWKLTTDEKNETYESNLRLPLSV